MAVIFIEGFDKVGPVSAYGNGIGLLLADWSITTVSSLAIGAPLSATGYSFSWASSAAFTLSRGFSAVSRLVGGCRFNVSSSPLSNPGIAMFLDSGTSQCCLTANASAGTISLRNGSVGGTPIATSGVVAVLNSTHYIEWDITFGNAAAYSVWLDGALLFSGTGDTTATANNTANGFGISSAANAGNFRIDDIYLFDTTGPRNNAVLLTSPRVETTFPISDSAVQFSVGAAVLGNPMGGNNDLQSAVNANDFYVRPFIPTRACTITAVNLSTSVTNASASFRPILYSDTGAIAPNTLLSTGPTVTGVDGNATLVMPLTTPQALTAGTRYWLGYMCDTTMANSLWAFDNLKQGRRATVTFASGAPATAPGTTSGITTGVIWGTVTLAAPVNYYEVAVQPPAVGYAAGSSYVSDSVVGHEDLYNFAALKFPPISVYTVAVKAFVQRSDTGIRTVSMRMKSSGTDNGGSLVGQNAGPNPTWLSSYFDLDPNGNQPWTGAALNAAQSGFKIDS
jgi:hypothetical protein